MSKDDVTGHIKPAGPAEQAVVGDDKVGEGIPPHIAQQLFGGGGGPPRQTQTITVNLPSTQPDRESDIQIVVDIVQDGFEGNVEATVKSHGVAPNAEEYAAISNILSSLV